jgi:hypothetical protein
LFGALWAHGGRVRSGAARDRDPFQIAVLIIGGE